MSGAYALLFPSIFVDMPQIDATARHSSLTVENANG
jgi:hypothetical protein